MISLKKFSKTHLVSGLLLLAAAVLLSCALFSCDTGAQGSRPDDTGSTTFTETTAETEPETELSTEATTETEAKQETGTESSPETEAQTEPETAPETIPETTAPETTSPETTTPVTTTTETKAPEKEPKPNGPATPVIPSTGRLPIINIDTGGREVVSRDNYVSCTVVVADAGGAASPLTAQIRVRGNSSAYYGKVDKIRKNPVPYKLKFDAKTNLLGLHDGKSFRDWVLLRADNDANSISNEIALRLGRAIIGEDQYCADACLVRLYMGGRDLGVYVLTEQCEVKKNRVNINEPDENSRDVLTGYYLEIENYTRGEVTFTQNYASATVTDIEGTTRAFKKVAYSVKSRINTDEQLSFIKKYMNNAFTVVYEACEKKRFLTFNDNFDLVEGDFPDAETAVGAVLDLDAAVNMYILYELVHDFDIGEGSFFMSVDLTPGVGDGRVTFTSPWDFDWICSGKSENKYWAATFCQKSFADQFGERSNPWFIVLAKQDWFIRRVKARWVEVLPGIRNALAEDSALIKTYARDLEDTYTPKRIVSWLTARADWLDKVWGK